MSRFKLKRFVNARVLASVMAAALLVFALLASNGPFHRAFHPCGNAASSSCVLCQFAHGHVDLPQSAPVLTTSVQSSFNLVLRMESIATLNFTYLPFLSRGPPALAYILPVMA